MNPEIRTCLAAVIVALSGCATTSTLLPATEPGVHVDVVLEPVGWNGNAQRMREHAATLLEQELAGATTDTVVVRSRVRLRHVRDPGSVHERLYVTVTTDLPHGASIVTERAARSRAVDADAGVQRDAAFAPGALCALTALFPPVALLAVPFACGSCLFLAGRVPEEQKKREGRAAQRDEKFGRAIDEALAAHGHALREALYPPPPALTTPPASQADGVDAEGTSLDR